MITTYLLFGLSLVIILVACELFSNGVEWFGNRLDLGEGAVGSILAAIGTALPETIIPVIAILFSADAGGEHIAIGAIVGSSFMLATLAMLVVGTGIMVLTVMGRRTFEVGAHLDTVSRDLRYFLTGYSLALAAAVIPARSIKLVVAAVLIGIYITYFRITIADCGQTGCDLKPLHFHREGLPPRWRFIALQLIIALGVIIYGAHLFVDQVIALSNHFAISALVLSLLITPIATELPEKFNSLIWVRSNKDTLAIGNITGAMVFQSCILPTFGILFTPWHLSESAVIAAALGLIASTIMLAGLKSRKALHAIHLVFSGIFYLGFIIYVILLSRLGEGFITKTLANMFSL
ncbi:MAG: sodium:calcium antiporter [Actinobacteria bacterium]|nr:sodium:calcium antiporter [Actinomycetota bacterium]